MSLTLPDEYLTPEQQAHLRASGYVIARMDESFADRVAWQSGVDYATVATVMDTMRDIA